LTITIEELHIYFMRIKPAAQFTNKKMLLHLSWAHYVIFLIGNPQVKWYQPFFMCSILFSHHHLLLNMEAGAAAAASKIPPREILLQILSQEDRSGILLRPDEGFTTEQFMKKLMLPKDTLEDLLSDFVETIMRKTRIAIQEYMSRNQEKFAKENFPDLKDILIYLCASAEKTTEAADGKTTEDEKPKATYEKFKKLRDTIFMVQTNASFDTGADLKHPLVNPVQQGVFAIIPSTNLIQQTKNRVKQRLYMHEKKQRFEELLSRFEDQK
jgi:hypothetical protein